MKFKSILTCSYIDKLPAVSAYESKISDCIVKKGSSWGLGWRT